MGSAARTCTRHEPYTRNPGDNIHNDQKGYAWNRAHKCRIVGLLEYDGTFDSTNYLRMLPYTVVVFGSDSPLLFRV